MGFVWSIPLESIECVVDRYRSRLTLFPMTKSHQHTGPNWFFHRNGCHSSTRFLADADPEENQHLLFSKRGEIRILGVRVFLPILVMLAILRSKLPLDFQRSALAIWMWFYLWGQFPYSVEWCTSPRHSMFDLAEATFCGRREQYMIFVNFYR